MKINPYCDLLIGNRPENDSDTQYHECEDCHRYKICKKYGCIEVCSLEKIKDAKPSIIEPSYDLLKQEGYFEMSMIRKRVKELRNTSDNIRILKLDGYAKIISEAADTIETLSAKLAAVNMERSVEGCGGWIPCNEKMPKEHDSIFAKLESTDKWRDAMFEKTSNEVNVTIEFEDGKRAVKTLHTIDERWNEGNRGLKFKVIAWQPLPEPYHEH